MRKIILLVLIAIIPVLQAAENEEVIKLLLCYDSPNSDYCVAEHVFKLKQRVEKMQRQLNTQRKNIQSLQQSTKTLQAEIVQLKRQQKNDAKHFAKLEAEMDSQHKAINEHFVKLESTMDSQHKAINEHFSKLETTMDSQHKAINEHFTKLETEMASQHEALDEHQKMLQKFATKITRLEHRLYRYVDNNDGTITDSRTHLIWLKNAHCFGQEIWYQAKQTVAKLKTGQCNLRDNSKMGEWRLPTKKEWEFMLEKKYRKLTLSNALGTGQWREGDAFVGVQLSKYWTASSRGGK